MKPLRYVPIEKEAESQLWQAFARSGIRVQITAATFLDKSKIWVEDADLARAQEILDAIRRQQSDVHRDLSRATSKRSVESKIKWLSHQDGLFWVFVFA